MRVAALAACTPALAGDPSLGPYPGDGHFPSLSIEVPIEINNDWAFDSDDPDAEYNELFAKIEPFVALGLSHWLSLEAALTFEPVEDEDGGPDPGADREFEDQGLFLEQLYARFSYGRFGLRLGKLNPAFGIAWDVTPGLYGVDFAEDYEVTERIGAEALVELGGERIGSHVLTGAAFYADTSNLSDSWITERGRTRSSDGGVSNTGELESFTFTLTGAKIPGLAGFGYHLGYGRQEAGVTETDDQTSWVGALTYGFSLANDVSVELIGEIADFDDFGGVGGDEATYSTLGVGVGFGAWTFAVADTWRELSGTTDSSDNQLQLSGTYAFNDVTELSLGYKTVREDDTDTQILGLQLFYLFSWGARE